MEQPLTSSAQVRSCLIASGGLLSSGMTVAFPSIYKEQKVTIDDTWLGSASHFAMIGGSLVVGPLMEAFGRKICLILALFLAFLGWLTVGSWLVPGRLLTGLSAGIASAPVSVLVAELSSARLRAHLTTYKHSAFSLGLFIMYCFGALFKDQRQFPTLICAGITCTCLILVVASVPETGTRSASVSYKPFFNALSHRKDVSRPFLLMATLSSLKQLSGTTVFLSYATQLLTEGGEKDAAVGAVWLGAVRLAASIAAAPLAGWLGRRALASFSGYLSALALLVVAGGTSHSLLYIIVFVFFSALCSSAIQALIGEVFPLDFRAVCTGLTTTTTYVSAFAALHSHPWLLDRMGFSRLLGIYATVAVITALIIICFLPDKAPYLKVVKDVELELAESPEVIEPLKKEKEVDVNT